MPWSYGVQHQRRFFETQCTNKTIILLYAHMWVAHYSLEGKLVHITLQSCVIFSHSFMVLLLPQYYVLLLFFVLFGVEHCQVLLLTLCRILHTHVIWLINWVYAMPWWCYGFIVFTCYVYNRCLYVIWSDTCYAFVATKMLLRLCTADRCRFVLAVKSVAEFTEKGRQTVYFNTLHL